MAATTIAALIVRVRGNLNEATAAFWSDDELASMISYGARDLWRRLNDLYLDYFVTIDITNVTLAASTSQLSGVPADVFRVVSIEPRILGSLNPNPGLIFKPAGYNDPRMVTARALGPVEPNNNVLYYTVMMQGSPVAAPIIRVAPQVSSAVNLALVYNQTLAAIDKNGTNPIPGESDNALVNWATAYAKARDRDDQAPDPEWLALYATDKTNLVAQLTPRSIQEPQVAEGLFGETDDWGWGY